MKIHYSAQTEASSVRPTRNEDCFATGEGRWSEDSGYLFVVADGICRPDDDCQIAKIAVEAICSRFYDDKSDNRFKAVQRAFAYANEQVIAAGRNELGATIVAALILDNDVHVANVGNGRAYLFRNGTLRQITQDHSLAAEFIRKGFCTERDLRIRPHSLFKVYKALGVESGVEADLFSQTLHPQDSIVLCTDGVSGWLNDNDDQIARVLQTCAWEHAAIELIALADRLGGHDDKTAMVILCQAS